MKKIKKERKMLFGAFLKENKKMTGTNEKCKNVNYCIFEKNAIEKCMKI